MIGHSPKVVTDGLVFYYDMENSKKSWKGAPTTNLHTQSQNLSGWSIQTNASVTANTSLDQFNQLTADRYTFNGVGVSNQVFLRNVTPTANLPYSCGACFRYVSGDTKINFDAYTYGTPGSWNGVTITYVDSSNITLSTHGTITNSGWSRVGEDLFWVYFTFTQTTVTGAVEFNINHELHGGISAYAQSTWDISTSQLEQYSFATPFTSTSRSTSQAVIDIVGNNTLTSTSVAYNIDNTFNYNGTSSEFVSGTTTIPQTNNVTVEAIIKKTGTNTMGFVIANGDTGSHGYWLSHGSSGLTFSVGNGTITYQFVPGTLSSNITYHVVGTYDGTTTKVYVNGVLYGSGTGTSGNINYTGVPSNFKLGNINGSGTAVGRWFDGYIYNAKIYNRALTAFEVLNNFNAHRARYGI